MNQQQSKKMRKVARNAVRSEIGEGLAALRPLMRKRPRWIPASLWAWLYWPVFKREWFKYVRHYLIHGE